MQTLAVHLPCQGDEGVILARVIALHPYHRRAVIARDAEVLTVGTGTRKSLYFFRLAAECLFV